MALKKKIVNAVSVPPKVYEAPVMVEVAPAVLLVKESAKEEPAPAPISSYPFRLIERWESEDKREIRKLEACPYGGNGIVIKTSTRFLDPAGNVTACSEAICTVPGVSMSTFEGSRRGKKEL